MSVNNSSDSEFISKLTRVVEANLADENFGVKELAQKTRMSRTQLHRKIKSINNQSVSQFIREIRLDKAKEMLQQDLGTVSEVAYKVGFGSPSYFIKCFHEYFGYPPGVLLKLPSDLDENDNSVQEQKAIFQSKRSEKRLKGILLNFLAGILIILTTVTISIFIYQNFIVEKKSVEKEKSIAVLPIKNLSENMDIQHLADGVMEDILNRLSHIEELKVKSRISSQQYRNPEISLPEIAKELNASYVLEGSIMYHENKVRIIVQLIEAKTDNHLWSKEYNQDLTNILDFTTEVSRQIADELQVALTSDEIMNLEKKYTENKEAYNLYLLGRYFWHRKTKPDLITCVKYYEQAIALDSSYAIAYAGLSDAHNSLTWSGINSVGEGVQKCKEFAMKAINLDNNLAEGHAALGDCASDFLLDWDLADKEMKLAIQLNPSLALTYKYYADFLNRLGRKNEARTNIDIAIHLMPESSTIINSSFNLYYSDRKFEEALYDIENLIQFQQMYKWPLIHKFKIYLHQNKHKEAINVLQQYFSFDSTACITYEDLVHVYDESGINGILLTAINYISEKQKENYALLAQLHALLNDKNKTLQYLENQYTEGKFKLLEIINFPEFEFLNDDPRFTALLKRMNLAYK